MDTILALFACEPRSLRCDRVNAVFGIRKLRQMNKPMQLLDILFETNDSLCCKRHDRVFGLFGLVLNGLDFLSEPNYEADLGDLSISMTRSYIERRSIDIILLAHYRGERSTLPSWSPDWFRFDEYTPDRHIHDQLVQRRNQDLSSACPKGWYTTGNACATFSVSNCTLKISARYLGTICSLGRSVRP
jgi:hypothetical protein